MCGIAGFSWPDEALAWQMVQSLRHRGPDDEGVFIDERVSLGHTRLSIIDLSPLGHQPMPYEHSGQRAVITFNGEIFNYASVRRELEALGHHFRSATDTEVILAAYLQWGPQCVQHFNGMWAFAIYEPAERRLLLSRDRFGEKPLHYWLHDGRLVFASEIKAILAHPLRRRARPDVVAAYLYLGEANSRLESFFAEVAMLPPAHNAVFELDTGALDLHRYYEPRRASVKAEPEVLRQVLRGAVERRLVADVPISISLSSGTDSTSVAALTAQLTPARVKAFSTTSEHGPGDETALVASFIARYPQFELEKSALSEASFCANYRRLIWHMDEPFARQSAYVRWEIANNTHRHGRKVLLNGEGADEVLGGYVTFAPRFLDAMLRQGRLSRFARELHATLLHPERDRILTLWREMRAQSRGTPAAESAAARRLQQRFGITLEPSQIEPRRYDDLKDFLHDWVHRSSLPRLLLCNDKMAMANSVEGRAPFLDHEFVDYAFSLDPQQLLVNGLRKAPLREAMRGLVPDEILFRRSKDAFHAPIFEYLRAEPLRDRVRQIFAEPRSASIFDPRAYLAEYDRFVERKGGDRLFLLHGLFLEEWARMFEVELG